MIEDADHETLRDRLTVWKGPLPFDVGREPEKLLAWVRETAPEARTVAIDSLKDVALDLTKDEVGSRVNAALQSLVAENVEVAVNHHQRKGQAGGGKPRNLEDVYGSTWLTAGTGSVILLWGKPGDLVVELDHLKQPLDPVGPMKLLHDHDRGRTTTYERLTALDVMRDQKRATVRVIAATLYGLDDPTRSDVERARRELRHLEAAGYVAETRKGDNHHPAEWRILDHGLGHAQFTEFHTSYRSQVGHGAHGAAQT